MPKRPDTFSREMSTFVRLLLCFISPFLLLLVIYLCTDPFKVVWSYDAFYPEQVAGGVSLNPGHVGTQNYLRQQPEQHYNAFILGNSRSIYYPVETWSQHLPEGSRCYHYDAAAESLRGIWQKLRLIEQEGGALDHVLLVVDASLLAKTDCDHWHLCEAPPPLTGYRNWLSFHWYNLKTFITPSFLLAYTDYRLFHELRPYMLEKSLLTEDMFIYDAKSNECNFLPLEQQIAAGTYYTEERKAVFEGRQFPDSTSPAVIGEAQRALLDSICSVLDRKKTNTHVVVSPLYDQIRLHPADKAELERRFGSGHVHDFSGPNEWNADYHNYYEASHYRSGVAKAILDSIAW